MTHKLAVQRIFQEHFAHESDHSQNVECPGRTKEMTRIMTNGTTTSVPTKVYMRRFLCERLHYLTRDP